MSALAARRAAAAASATNGDSSQPSLASSASGSQSGQSRKDLEPIVQLPTSPSPSVESDASESEESVEETAPPTSSKKRKIDTAIRAPTPPASQRYFAQTPSTKSKSKSRPVKAFSPSLPVDSEEDEEEGHAEVALDEEDEGDSSDDQSDLDDPEVIDDIDNGRVRWDTSMGFSAPSTPGPSTYDRRTLSTPRKDMATSNWALREGVNMLRIPEEALQQAGIEGPGPGVLISLSQGENLMIAGIYTLTPIQQPLSIFSSTLTPSNVAYPVFAPTSHPIPIITGVQSSRTIKTPLLSKLSLPSSFSLYDGKSPRSVFLIREHSCGLDGTRGGAVPGFTNIWLHETGPWGLRNVHPVVGSFPNPVYPHIIPPSWTAALETIQHKGSRIDGDGDVPVVLVKGPKRVGKSTLARSALNTLLEGYEKVAWLESDLGQGEFGCGGVVGLYIIDRPVFGPPFSHPSIPVRAHYMGTYTPVTCPDEYISAIRHLLDVYKYEIQYPSTHSTLSSNPSTKRKDAIPLVINTQGWVKGLGDELLRSIELCSQPTHVFAFDAPQPVYPQNDQDEGITFSPGYNPAMLLPEQGGPSEMAKMVLVQPAPISPLQARYTSSDMRILGMISYLHSSLSFGSPRWSFDSPLPGMSPLEVIIGESGAIKEVYLIGEGSDGVVQEDLSLALNGSIVALCKVDNPSRDVYVPSRFPIMDETTTFGLGLIRGIEEVQGGYAIQLITTLPGSILGNVNAVIKNGSMELPLCGLVDWKQNGSEVNTSKGESKGERMWGMDIRDVPFLQRHTAGGVGIERKRVRRNLQRRNV